jgi:hypothetical protein
MGNRSNNHIWIRRNSQFLWVLLPIDIIITNFPMREWILG